MSENILLGVILASIGLMTFTAEVYWICSLIRKKRRCTTLVQGWVVDYYPNALPLPIVEYTVGGASYRVKGPEFRIFTSRRPLRNQRNGISFLNLFSRRRTGLDGVTRETLPQKVTVYGLPTDRAGMFKVARSIGDADAMKQQVAEIASHINNPLSELYPIGSTANVYYDPSKPDLAYVQRPLGILAVDYFAIIIAAAMSATGIAILVFGL